MLDRVAAHRPRQGHRKHQAQRVREDAAVGNSAAVGDGRSGAGGYKALTHEEMLVSLLDNATRFSLTA